MAIAVFRALPVLGNEMIPWTMVEAVPGTETRGVAIVATLDNVSTRWTALPPRATVAPYTVLLRPCSSMVRIRYEVMAETMTASITTRYSTAGNGLSVTIRGCQIALAYARRP